MNVLDQTVEHREQVHEVISMQLAHYQRKNRSIQTRLSTIMQKFEMCRGKNVPLQNAERQALQKLMELARAVEDCGKMLEGVKRDANDCQRNWDVMKQQQRLVVASSGAGSAAAGGKLDAGFKDEVMTLLNESKTGIDTLKKAVKRNERDMDIIKSGGGVKAVGMA